jgi:hypothetical protein
MVAQAVLRGLQQHVSGLVDVVAVMLTKVDHGDHVVQHDWKVYLTLRLGVMDDDVRH